MTDPDLALESRRLIYQRVVERPGVHFRALVDDLEYAPGTVQYHLRWLAEEGLLEVADDGQYTRYYPADSFDEADRAVMNALRREIARKIVAHLAADGPLTTGDLADRIGKAPSTVSWHLSKLEDADLLTRERQGRAVEYDLRDPDRVRYLYTVHRKTFLDRAVDRLFDIWDAY